ncbi:MAG: hypothetical protein F4053_02235 [Proteobacteria bacterium]|nr:hypothetical protein [Pseudomonadota bacterium]MYJ94437.1 hypothetical protein [Pseudomonadota bacterium]
MELFSGLLLTLVVLAILAYVARELIVEDSGGALKKYLGDSPAVEAPMLGKRGIVENDTGELLRVRIEGERWSANSIVDTVLPAGTPVRVTAVNGLVLDVEQVVEED